MTVIANIPNTRPILLLDFANSRGVSPLIKCARPTTGTYVDRDGFMRLAPAKSPRITHDGVTLACLGLLDEGPQTNVFTYSEDLTQAAWVKTNVTLTDAPLVGILKPTILTESAAAGEHSLSRDIQPFLTAEGDMTFQTFLREDTSRFVIVGVQKNDSYRGYIKIDLRTGEWLNGINEMTLQWTVNKLQSGLVHVIGRANTTFGTAAVAGQCYFKIAKTSIASTLTDVENVPPVYVGSTDAKIAVAGIQCAQTPVLGSYIPTSATAVTRAGDGIQLDGIRLPSEYTVVTDHSVNLSMTDFNALYTLKSDSPAMDLRFVTTINGNTRPEYDGTALTQMNIPVLSNQPRRRSGLAVTGKVLRSAVNGAVANEIAHDTVTGVTVTLFIGSTSAGQSPFHGTINRIIIYPQALTFPQLKQATYIHT